MFFLINKSNHFLQTAFKTAVLITFKSYVEQRGQTADLDNHTLAAPPLNSQLVKQSTIYKSYEKTLH